MSFWECDCGGIPGVTACCTDKPEFLYPTFDAYAEAAKPAPQDVPALKLAFNAARLKG